MRGELTAKVAKKLINYFHNLFHQVLHFFLIGQIIEINSYSKVNEKTYLNIKSQKDKQAMRHE